MQRSSWKWMVALALVIGVAAPATAQTDPPPRAYDYDDSDVYPEFPEPSPDLPRERMAIYFDMVGRLTMRHVEPFTPFEFYVVAHHSRVAVRGWEAEVIIDPRITIVSRDFQGLNVAAKPDQWMVGIKPKFCLEGDDVVLVKYTAILQEEGLQDMVLGLGPLPNSSFEPPSPGYLVCRPGADLRDYQACRNCAVLNPLKKAPDNAVEDKPAFLRPVRGKH